MGKGSARRKEDTDKIRDNWEATFGKKKDETPAKKEDSTKTK
jgi:hypothetical protein